MAGDWIKMRVWLARDPRVIAMADYLSAEPRFMNGYGIGCLATSHNVTRNVTVALCVTGLLVTWGTAREQGDRENLDLIVKHCRLSTLDAMTGLPFFGAAMLSVGWAKERDDGALVLPNFFKDNESPDDRHRRQNADRQARFRDKQRPEVDPPAGNVTHNVTVTHREEKRREEKTKDIVLPPGFQNFWQSYPATQRRVAKRACLQAWVKGQCESRAGDVVAHVKAMRDTTQWREGYEPAPLTYLNQRRWEDGLPVAAEQKLRGPSM